MALDSYVVMVGERHGNEGGIFSFFLQSRCLDDVRYLQISYMQLTIIMKMCFMCLGHEII